MFLDRMGGCYPRMRPSVANIDISAQEQKRGRALPVVSPSSVDLTMLICRLPNRKAVEGDGKVGTGRAGRCSFPFRTETPPALADLPRLTAIVEKILPAAVLHFQRR